MFSVHYPCNNYDQILDVLSTTKTNSEKTSSLPLADFWHPERNKDIKENLFLKIVGDRNPQADYCFEYATPAFKNRKAGKTIQYSKSSMTDLMIFLGKECRITIEAKYTEFVKEAKYTPLLNEWLVDGKSHRKEIAQCWIDYIKDSGCCDIKKLEELLENSPELPYQFLHRTASACFQCQFPILVYQLFYDEADKGKMIDFEKLLNKCAKDLKLKQDRLPFYIVENKIKKIKKIQQHRKGDTSGIFIEMKLAPKYIFENTITILNGYTLEEV